MGSTTAVLAIGFVLPRRAHEFRAPNLEHYSCQSRIPAAVQHYKRVCAEQQAGVGGSCWSRPKGYVVPSLYSNSKPWNAVPQLQHSNTRRIYVVLSLLQQHIQPWNAVPGTAVRVLVSRTRITPATWYYKCVQILALVRSKKKKSPSSTFCALACLGPDKCYEEAAKVRMDEIM